MGMITSIVPGQVWTKPIDTRGTLGYLTITDINPRGTRVKGTWVVPVWRPATVTVEVVDLVQDYRLSPVGAY